MTDINIAAQDLLKSDDNALLSQLGSAVLEFPSAPQNFVTPGAKVTVDVKTAGALDDAILLGKRILNRWNVTLYDLCCGDGGKIDPTARKTIVDAVKGAKPDAIATAITGVLIAYFSVGPTIALIVGVLLGKILLPAAGQEVCAFWKERLPKLTA